MWDDLALLVANSNAGGGGGGWGEYNPNASALRYERNKEK